MLKLDIVKDLNHIKNVSSFILISRKMDMADALKNITRIFYFISDKYLPSTGRQQLAYKIVFIAQLF